MQKKIRVMFTVFLAAVTALIFFFFGRMLGSGQWETAHSLKISAGASAADGKTLFSETGDWILSGFEGRDPARWGRVRTAVVSSREVPFCPGSRDNSRLNHCLKAVYPKGDFPGMSSLEIPADWSGFSTLAMDVYNPSETVVPFGILIKDKPGGHGYADRYDGQFALRPGRNTFVMNVTGLKTNDSRRRIDQTQIMELTIFLVGPKEPVTLYFDNIRLQRGSGDEIEGMRRFDFGPEGSEVWPGFIEVTDTTRFRDDSGYGWQETDGLSAEDRRYPDALFRDWVRGDGTFKVTVKNVRYVVYLMLEDPGFWDYYQNYEERKIFAQDKLVGYEVLPPEIFFRDYYFAHRDHEDFPGADVFEHYVQKRFVWRRFETDAAGREISLRVESGGAYAGTLSALIIAPLSRDTEVQSYLKKLDEERREFFEGRYVERIPAPEPLPETLGEAFMEKGFVLFHQGTDDPMLPGSAPREDQAVKTISLMAYPGDIEPFVLGVYPMDDLGSVRVQVTDLVSDNGYVIRAEQIRRRVVQYKLKLTDPNIYMVRGELLRDWPSAQARWGITRFFWTDIHVPEDMPPGRYEGNAEVVSELTGAAQTVSLELDVLPFVPDEADIPIGLFYAVPPRFDWYPQMKDQKWTAIERQMKDMRAHGMNTLALSYGPEVKKVYENGHVLLDMTFFSEFFRALRHFGFDQPVSGYGMISVFHDIRRHAEGRRDVFEKAMVNAFTQINDSARLFTGHNLVIGLADEVSNTGHEGIDSVMEAARILKDAGFNATGYLNSPDDEKIFPYIRTATVNNGMRISEAFLKRAEKTGTDLWFYNIGQNRFTFGFYLWRTRARGRLEWHYQLPAVDPYFDLDGREGDFCASYPSSEAPVNAVWFALAREGIKDYRYVITLERVLKEIIGSNIYRVLPREERPPVIAEAWGFLDQLRKDISVELNSRERHAFEYHSRRRAMADMTARLLRFQRGD